jgi:putative hydrolase of the HAD superfamily
MSKVKFIYFDLANTLVQQPDFYQSIADFLASKNVFVNLNLLKKTHKLLSEEIQFPDKTTKDFYLEFNLKWMSKLDLVLDINMAEQIFDNGKGKSWVPFEDTSVLHNINVPKGIISNWDLTLPDKLKQYFKLEFDKVIGSALVGFQKPDPRIFLHAIKVCGFEPEEMMMVGDSIRLDIIPANKVGIRTVLIDREDIFSNFNGLRIKNLNELFTLL